MSTGSGWSMGLSSLQSEGADGGGAVFGDEEHGGVTGCVVDGGDGADVVAVECPYPALDGEVPARVSGSFECGDVVGGVCEASGLCSRLRRGGVAEPVVEGGEVEVGEVGDTRGVGVGAGGEALGLGAADRGQQVVLGSFCFAGEGEAAGVVAFADLGGLAAGGVEGGAVSGSGEGDVGGFAVEAGGSDDEHGVAGGALALVDGHRVAVIQVPGSEVVVVETDRVAGAQQHVERAALDINGDDGSEHAVVDPDRSSVGGVLVGVVAAGEHAITGLERCAADGECGAGEEAFVGGTPSGEPVECVCFAAGAGQEERVAARGVGGPPVVDGGAVEHEWVVGDADAVVGEVGVPCGGDVAVAEVIERVDLPWFDLAAVGGELADVVAQRGDRSGESSARSDFGELAVVADQDHLRAGPRAVVTTW